MRRRRSWLARQSGRRVIAHLTDHTSIDGRLADTDPHGLVLDPATHADSGHQLAGAAWIPTDRLAWLQLPGDTHTAAADAQGAEAAWGRLRRGAAPRQRPGRLTSRTHVPPSHFHGPHGSALNPPPLTECTGGAFRLFLHGRGRGAPAAHRRRVFV